MKGLPTNHHFPGVHYLQTVIQKMCFFCQNVDHYSDKCNILTEIDKRRELLKRNRLCLNCLRGGHTKKNCRKQITCFKSKTDDNSKEDFSNNLVKSNTLILLQTANAIVTDEKENQCYAVKILLDPGSQQTFIT